MKVKELYKLFEQAGYRVSTDSRNIDDGVLFFALKGERFDGNAFAAQALEKGASAAIIDNPKYHIPGKTFLVKDSLEALQQLARFHRTHLVTKIIGLTGTAGKTTTKELIHSVLSTTFNARATKGNLNNHIGVPLTLLSLRPDTEIAVVEMGASKPGEIWDLCQIARPDMGLITNIGTAHIQGFGSHENLIKTKAGLYRYLEQNNGLIFQNIDDKLLRSLTQHDKIYTYGTSKEAQTQGNIIEQNPFLKFFFIDKHNNHIDVQTLLFGKYNIYNLLAAVAIGQYLDIDDQKIAKALGQYQPHNNRSQIHTTQKNTLILDLYNANPTSMGKALESFAELKANNKVLILGDMLELGEIEQQEHKRILDLAENLGFSEIYLVGQIFGKVNNKYPQFDSSKQMLQWLQQNPLQNKTILLKASHGIHLETLIQAL